MTRKTKGTMLHRGVAFDGKAPEGQQYVITEEYIGGYVVVARFPTVDAAKAALADFEEGSR